MLQSQRAPSAPTTLVFDFVPTLHFMDSQQACKTLKDDMHDEFTNRLCWKGNIICGCFVMATFFYNYAATNHFSHHADAGSRMATWPSSVSVTHSLLGCSASRFFTTVGCCHSKLAHRETCNTRFTAKWAPQYRRPQTTTKNNWIHTALWTCPNKALSLIVRRVVTQPRCGQTAVLAPVFRIKSCVAYYNKSCVVCYNI